MRLVLSVCTFHYLYFDEFWEHDIIIWLFISDDVFLLKASREFIRDDMMSFIQGNNKDGRDILIRFFYHWRWSWVWLRWWFEDQNADQWRSQESKWRRLGWVRTTKTWSLRRNKVSWEELKSWWLSSSPSSLSSLSIQKASLFLGVNSSFTEECHYHHCFCPPGGLTGCWSTPPYSHHPQVIWQEHHQHHHHYYHLHHHQWW